MSSGQTGGEAIRGARGTISLHLNPFFILGATTQDSGGRLTELAEERSLVLDPDVCQRARSDLISHRTRLAAEIAWFPGLSPLQAEQAAASITNGGPVQLEGLPPWAIANLICALLESQKGTLPRTRLVELTAKLALAVDETDVDALARGVNEDRSVAGVPPVKDRDLIESEIAARRRHFRQVARDGMDLLPTNDLVAAMTELADHATAGGKRHAPWVIEDLVDAYEASAQAFMQAEANNVETLTRRIQAAAKGGEQTLAPIVSELCRVAANWAYVTRPIQIVGASTGRAHEASLTVAEQIRALAVELHNSHQMIETAAQLTEALSQQFGALTAFAEQLADDAAHLARRKHDLEQAKEDQAEFDRAITYAADIGVLFKERFEISRVGISWRGRRYRLEQINRIRWGGTRHSASRIQTGVTYRIGFGTDEDDVVIEVGNADICADIVDRLWRTVGLRILVTYASSLKAGGRISIQDAVFEDEAVVLQRRRNFRANEPVRLTWYQVEILSSDGNFIIRSKDDRNAYTSLSYQDVSNVHVIEQMIRILFNSGKPNLSSILEQSAIAIAP